MKLFKFLLEDMFILSFVLLKQNNILKYLARTGREPSEENRDVGGERGAAAEAENDNGV